MGTTQAIMKRLPPLMMLIWHNLMKSLNLKIQMELLSIRIIIMYPIRNNMSQKLINLIIVGLNSKTQHPLVSCLIYILKFTVPQVHGKWIKPMCSLVESHTLTNGRMYQVNGQNKMDISLTILEIIPKLKIILANAINKYAMMRIIVRERNVEQKLILECLHFYNDDESIKESSIIFFQKVIVNKFYYRYLI